MKKFMIKDSENQAIQDEKQGADGYHSPYTKIEGKSQKVCTNKEASSYLRTSQVTLWRERKKGNIVSCRVAGKIVYLQEDLDNYLNRNRR